MVPFGGIRRARRLIVCKDFGIEHVFGWAILLVENFEIALGELVCLA